MEQLTGSDIAQPEEVLRVMTAILRGEMSEDKTSGGPKISERCKAAELLGKRYGLFERPEEPPPDREAAARAVAKALRQLRERHAEQRG